MTQFSPIRTSLFLVGGRRGVVQFRVQCVLCQEEDERRSHHGSASLPRETRNGEILIARIRDIFLDQLIGTKSVQTQLCHFKITYSNCMLSKSKQELKSIEQRQAKTEPFSIKVTFSLELKLLVICHEYSHEKIPPCFSQIY